MEALNKFLNIVIPIIFSPLLFGVVNYVKAKFAGRKGQSVFQTYYDILKLFNKTSVYSDSSTYIFRIAPVLIISTMVCVLFLLPFGNNNPIFEFSGSFIIIFYMLALSRFFMIISALDTASSFEGMGAAREAFFSFLAEISIFVSLSSLSLISNSTLVSEMFSHSVWNQSITASLIISISFFIALLCENSRVPFDDPNTHLELTMVHEVMVLDSSGPDFALISYAASLKMWIFSSLIALIIPIGSQSPYYGFLLFFFKILAVSVLVGSIESVFARVRLKKIPEILAVSIIISIVSFVVVAVNKGIL
ncbi:MAG TPA: NADH-quinone oxidoreductase subunit H [Elusimicrobiales bacterium]|nr:NADH-quinone oxidoreductase subunit H [Elusimicrobiales bacterium]HOL62342.1 NADH-quinone oxidoreductase subunit H [Elusimicrobiales bacterium]HPO95604.1 NADH-quinone oxidoreductase subunit H [Elusimicrobiales bacterium]